jgi:hypothetical protein
MTYDILKHVAEGGLLLSSIWAQLSMPAEFCGKRQRLRFFITSFFHSFARAKKSHPGAGWPMGWAAGA